MVGQDDFPLQERKYPAFTLAPDVSNHRDLMGFVYITGKTTALPQNGAHLSDIPGDGKDGHEWYQEERWGTQREPLRTRLPHWLFPKWGPFNPGHSPAAQWTDVCKDPRTLVSRTSYSYPTSLAQLGKPLVFQSPTLSRPQLGRFARRPSLTRRHL